MSIKIKKIDQLFVNTATSYKYFWGLALLRQIEKRKYSASFEDLVIEMMALSWEPVIQQKLKMPKNDGLYEALLEVNSFFRFSQETTPEHLFETLKKEVKKAGAQWINRLIRRIEENVPYRFLSPWLPFESNQQVIRESQKQENGVFYAIQGNAQEGFQIEFHPEWFYYCDKNLDSLKEKFIKETEKAFSKWNGNQKIHFTSLKECFKTKHTVSLYTYVELFLKQSTNKDLKTANRYIKEYSGLRVRVGFGQTNKADTPWMAFLGGENEVTNGFYIALLYYKKQNKLILSYCESEKNKARYKWEVPAHQPTIKEYFLEHFEVRLKRYGASHIYKIYDITQINEKEFNTDLSTLIVEYKRQLEALPFEADTMRIEEDKIPSQASPSIVQIPLDLETLNKDIRGTHLIYDKKMVNRFALSLATKPFLILSGLAGSGKTQLALAFARWMTEDAKKQICFVPVGADWTNRECLLGYANSLDPGTYIKPDNGVLDLLIRAKEHPEKPYFLVLDEMNLSYVERYFADFLSALESHEEIPIMENGKDETIPSSLALPSNLFIIGTINVDETTYMFSPKVLDRAQVLEFRIMDGEMEAFLQEMQPIDMQAIIAKGANQSASFVERATSRAEISSDRREKVATILLQFFTSLKVVNAEFGYRTASDIYRFIGLAEVIDTGMKDDELIDVAIVQKLLPKLHGARKKIEPVLKMLWSFCLDKQKEALPIERVEKWELNEALRFPLSAEKIWRMYQGCISNGFTSFAEA